MFVTLLSLSVLGVGVGGSKGLWGWFVDTAAELGMPIAAPQAFGTTRRAPLAAAATTPVPTAPKSGGVAASSSSTPLTGLYVGKCAKAMPSQQFEITPAGELRSVSMDRCVACHVEGDRGACLALGFIRCGTAVPLVFAPNRTTGLFSTRRANLPGAPRVCLDVCTSTRRVPSCVKRETLELEVLLYSCHAALNQRWRMDKRSGTVRSFMYQKWQTPHCLTASPRDAGAPLPTGLVRAAAPRNNVIKRSVAAPTPTAKPWQRGDPLPHRRCHYNNQPIADRSKRFAVMTMLIEPSQCDDSNGQAMHFAEGIEVLGYSLTKHVVRRDYVKLVLLDGRNFVPGSAATKACAARLARAGWTACIAAPIDPPVPSKFKRFSQLFIKFVAFNMVEFEKVLIVDGDVAVVGPGFGKIFDAPVTAMKPLAAVRDYMARRGGWQRDFNLGVALVKTDAQLFDRLFTSLMEGEMKYNHQMSEQGFLQAYLASNRGMSWHVLNWTMVGNLDMLEGGRGGGTPHAGHATGRQQWESAAARNEISAVHFTACKPFCGPEPITARCKKPRCYDWGYAKPIEQWLQLRSEMKSAGAGDATGGGKRGGGLLRP